MLKQKSSDLIPAKLNKIWLIQYTVPYNNTSCVAFPILMAVKICSAVYWVIIVSSLVGQYCLHSEDGGSMFLCNVGVHLESYKMS
jgi:hypothetical protein